MKAILLVLLILLLIKITVDTYKKYTRLSEGKFYIDELTDTLIEKACIEYKIYRVNLDSAILVCEFINHIGLSATEVKESHIEVKIITGIKIIIDVENIKNRIDDNFEYKDITINAIECMNGEMELLSFVQEFRYNIIRILAKEYSQINSYEIIKSEALKDKILFNEDGNIIQ